MAQTRWQGLRVWLRGDTAPQSAHLRRDVGLAGQGGRRLWSEGP